RAFFFSSYLTPRVLHSFPTRRSSDLNQRAITARESRNMILPPMKLNDCLERGLAFLAILPLGKCKLQNANLNLPTGRHRSIRFIDRKSTRLNSSHLVISYAVFCLKKK